MTATVQEQEVGLSLLLALQRALASGRGALGSPSKDEGLKALETAIHKAHEALGAAAVRADPDDEQLFFNDQAVASRQHGRAMAALLGKLRNRGIAELRFARPLTDTEVATFANLVRRAAAGLDPVAACRKIVEGLWETRLRGTVDLTSLEQYGHSARVIRIDPAVQSRLAYARLLTLFADYLDQAGDRELRRHFTWRLTKAVQALVASSATNEQELLGFTQLRGVDRFLVKHGVNTCILAVLLGQRLGLPRALLCQLGLAGLLCWSGKSRTPPAVVNRPPSARTPEEAKEYGRHPYRALGALFELRRLEEPLLLSALCALQFESRPGVPRRRKPLEAIHPLAQIVALCDAFDGHMSVKPGAAPKAPHAVLETILGDKRRAFDPTLVQLFIGLVGGLQPV